MATQQSKLSSFPVKTTLSANDRIIIYSADEKTDMAIAANNLLAGVLANSGYTTLPNGLSLEWGNITANSTPQTFLWPNDFNSNAFSVVCNPTANLTWTKQTLTVQTSGDVSVNVYIIAVGV